MSEKIRLTPRDISSAQKKEHIYNIAINLFKTYGYDNVTMKMICKEAEVAEGSIYHFFGEKAGILSIMSSQIQKSIYHFIEPTDLNLNDPAEAIYNYMVAQSDMYESFGKDINKVYLYNVEKFYKRQSNHVSDFTSTVHVSDPDLIKFIETAIKREKMECSIDATELAFSLDCLGSGMLHTWIVQGEGYGLHETATKIFRNTVDTFITVKERA